MNRDCTKTNEQLLDCQKKWFEIVEKWIEDNRNNPTDKKKRYFSDKCKTEKFSFSHPFFTSLYQMDDNKPLIMFIGQETNGWGDYFGDENKAFEGVNEIETAQNFVKEYTWNNVKNQDKKHRIDYKNNKYTGYNSYSFWRFIRDVYKKSGNNTDIVWTELDKIHYCCNHKKCITLWTEDEVKLNGPLCDGKTILQHEIDIVKPNLVVFLVGPNYYKSMETALQKSDLYLYIPSEKESFTEFKVYDTECLWSYHPNFLLRRFGLWDKVRDRITEIITNNN